MATPHRTTAAAIVHDGVKAIWLEPTAQASFGRRVVEAWTYNGVVPGPRVIDGIEKMVKALHP